MHYLIDYCQLIKHHSYVCPWYLKHNLLTIRALLWLQHHSCALLVDLRRMTGRCSQVNLPVNIRDALSLRCCWAPNGGQNVGLFLFPPHRYRFASFFLGLDLRGQEVVQLFLVHIFKSVYFRLIEKCYFWIISLKHFLVCIWWKNLPFSFSFLKKSFIQHGNGGFCPYS